MYLSPEVVAREAKDIEKLDNYPEVLLDKRGTDSDMGPPAIRKDLLGIRQESRMPKRARSGGPTWFCQSS